MIAVGVDASMTCTASALNFKSECEEFTNINSFKRSSKLNHVHRASIMGYIEGLTTKAGLVCIEAPIMHNKHLNGFAMSITLSTCIYDMLIAYKIPTLQIAVSTVKKYLTGDGHAEKEDMLAAAQILDSRIANDDEADAYGLMLFAKDILTFRESGVLPGDKYKDEKVKIYSEEMDCPGTIAANERARKKAARERKKAKKKGK